MAISEESNLAVELERAFEAVRAVQPTQLEPEIDIRTELARALVDDSTLRIQEAPDYFDQTSSPRHMVGAQEPISWRERIKSIGKSYKAAHFAGSLTLQASVENDLPEQHRPKERFTNKLVKQVAVGTVALLSFGVGMVANEQSTSLTAATPSSKDAHATEVLGLVIARPAEAVPLPDASVSTPKETPTPANVITITIPENGSVWGQVDDSLEARGINDNKIVNAIVADLERRLGSLSIVQPGFSAEIVVPSS